MQFVSILALQKPWENILVNIIFTLKNNLFMVFGKYLLIVHAQELNKGTCYYHLNCTSSIRCPKFDKLNLIIQQKSFHSHVLPQFYPSFSFLFPIIHLFSTIQHQKHLTQDTDSSVFFKTLISKRPFIDKL